MKEVIILGVQIVVASHAVPPEEIIILEVHQEEVVPEVETSSKAIKVVEV